MLSIHGLKFSVTHVSQCPLKVEDVFCELIRFCFSFSRGHRYPRISYYQLSNGWHELLCVCEQLKHIFMIIFCHSFWHVTCSLIYIRITLPFALFHCRMCIPTSTRSSLLNLTTKTNISPCYIQTQRLNFTASIVKGSIAKHSGIMVGSILKESVNVCPWLDLGFPSRCP